MQPAGGVLHHRCTPTYPVQYTAHLPIHFNTNTHIYLPPPRPPVLLEETVTSGMAGAVLKYGIIPFYAKTWQLCDLVHVVHSHCPVKKGTVMINFNTTVPGDLPSVRPHQHMTGCCDGLPLAQDETALYLSCCRVTTQAMPWRWTRTTRNCCASILTFTCDAGSCSVHGPPLACSISTLCIATSFHVHIATSIPCNIQSLAYIVCGVFFARMFFYEASLIMFCVLYTQKSFCFYFSSVFTVCIYCCPVAGCACVRTHIAGDEAVEQEFFPRRLGRDSGDLLRVAVGYCQWRAQP